MKDRVGALLGTERPRAYVGTFHAWGVRLLRRFPDEAGVPTGFVVVDSDDQLAVVKRAMKEVALPEKSATPRQIQSRISQAKNEGIQPDDFPRRFGDFLGSRLADIARAYEKSLRAAKALDFDDLLVLSTRLVATRDDVRDLLRRSIRHLLVDEYQDTNRVQAKLVRLIAGEAGNLFVVGDEDQSIYRWRGADVSNILEFAREFPTAKTVRLERNYRSTAPILKAAAAVEVVEAAACERGVSLLTLLAALREGLTQRAKKALAEFRDLVAKLRDFGAAEGSGAGAAVAFTLEETGLLKLYEL